MNRPEFEIALALRAFLRSGQADAVKVLPDLLTRAAAVKSPEAAAECASLLASVLRGQRDVLLMTRSFQALLGLGRLGRALAALHIQARIQPLPQLTPLIAALPGRDMLALVNDMLQDAPAADKQLAAWLKSLLPAPGRLDPREALMFLKALADDGLPLARPLRDALFAAGLADAMPRGFAGSPSPATATVLLGAAAALDSPAVQAEALGYSLRAAGAEGPSRLGPLLAAPPDLEPRDAALAAEMRRLALQPDAALALSPAAQTEPETLGLVLADLIRGGGAPAMTALGLTPLLPRLGMEACLEDLAEPLRAPIIARAFLAIARQEPEFLQRAARALSLGGEAVQALAALLKAQPALDPGPWAAQQPLPAGPQKPAQARKPSFVEALKDALTPLKDQDFSCSAVSGASVEGPTLTGLDLSHSRFSACTFRRVRFSSPRLANAAFENCAFSGCVFTNADLACCQFTGCRFEACSFEFCDFGHSRLSDCVLASCSLAESNLALASLAKTRLDTLFARTCSLAGMRLHECLVAHGQLQRCDLSTCLFSQCLCRDTEFTACTLSGSRLAGCEVLGTTFTRSGLAGVEVHGGHTDNPHLAQARRATRARCLSGPAAAKAGALPAPLQSGPGAEFVRASVERFLRVDEARGTLAAMRGQNQRRRELALTRLTEPQGEYLRLLPLLLATDVFEKAQGIPGVPACSVSDRALEGGLGRDARALLEKYFPGQKPTEKIAPQLAIEAVYAIGSLGSVAQKPSSDIDCWLCYEELDGAMDGARQALMRKLAALEVWTMQTFALETHFFAMPLAEVRQNNFGMSDKESSGSAQAALLKEEFYRTAHRLAGKDLLWWAAPPSAEQAQADALAAELAALAPRVAAEIVDLGQPMPIPPGEYFGACLWQIVKALHSPYKSVMKLGLLEKYAGQDKNKRLLCDRIKEAAMRGRRRPEEVDPYLSLFAAIRRHYRELSDTTSLGLIGECLRLKADVDPDDLPPEFLQAVPAPQSGQPGAGEAAHYAGFAGALRLGSLVNLFMISAYRRIQEGIRADRNAAQITPEDLTRLGRRIAANFAQHEHKVGLVPFLSEDIGFAELFFYAEKAPGKRTIWAVKGREKDSGKAAVESLAPIRRDTDVVRLIAWLLFNGIYDTRLAVQAEKSFAPIAVMDLQNLLSDLAAFFPRRATLEPDLDEYLKPERVARAYIILNLPVPPDKNKVLTASVVYATNWGEVYCQSFDNPSPLITKSPLGFLREFLVKPIPQNIDLRAFTPKKSACPRLKLG